MIKKDKICEEIIMQILKCDFEILRELNCQRLSKMYGLHRSTLSKIFKKCRGIYFRESIKRIKLLRCALFMAEERDLTVKKISVIFGFKSADYFIKSFKKMFGITPGEFRRLN